MPYPGQSKQANIHMYVHNAVPLVWGSLRLAPIINVMRVPGVEMNV